MLLLLAALAWRLPGCGIAAYRADGSPGPPTRPPTRWNSAPHSSSRALFVSDLSRLRLGPRPISAKLALFGLAAIVGFTDIDPFVLSIAAGGAAPLSAGAERPRS